MNKTETWNGYTIRFVEHRGEWWAVLADIAKALDLNPKFIKQRLGDEVVSKNHVADSLGRQQEMLIVNEFGIYETIFSSRKKEAKTFKLWVFETIKQLRQSIGLEGFQVFRMFDKEHQKQAMNRLVDGLQNVTKKDLIKANTIANKAVSDLYGYPKMVSKNEMTENMLRDREPILDETVELIKVKEKYGLNFSVSEAIYNQNTIKKRSDARG
ncbi:UNVERIFIED_CONTAM: Bro-N domain-containing protein [Streptococcus canis]|uniref:BRO-N domain-containing protein n=1 Tax=Streptococcus canis TaxID=1329 RepID=UPI0010CA20D0|nr:Bro-N domain-containing protein [Streptococcus canis]VTR79111.1 BRO family, N-terminal domain protein [Streptococcus canis]